MRNGNGSATGNDGGFDNVRVLDATPQLDKSFSPARQIVGQPTTLTFTDHQHDGPRGEEGLVVQGHALRRSQGR